MFQFHTMQLIAKGLDLALEIAKTSYDTVSKASAEGHHAEQLRPILERLESDLRLLQNARLAVGEPNEEMPLVQVVGGFVAILPNGEIARVRPAQVLFDEDGVRLLDGATRVFGRSDAVRIVPAQLTLLS